MGDTFRSDTGAEVELSNEDALSSWRPGPCPDVAGSLADEPCAEQGLAPDDGEGYGYDGYVEQLSHDLRTPLNAIIGFTELLQDGHLEPTSPDYHDTLATIVGNGRRLLSLVDELLTRTEQHVRGGKSGRPPRE